ncbi:MAG TPA: hypothetical protein VK203_24475 [Nostocaceae cyanobacterium]|nr:hypothetical protein [Nostocaceae cyanobacterium]
MAQKSHQPRPRGAKINQPRAGSIAKITKTSPKRERRGSWLWSFFALLVLFSSAGLITAFGWISILLIFNPEQVIWLNKFLPTWAQIPLPQGQNPQTLQEIQVSLNAEKLISGETFALDGEENKSILLPIFRTRPNCQSDCQELVELRVYKRSKNSDVQSQSTSEYYLVNQLPIVGLEESFVKGVGEIENLDAKVYLPVTEIGAFPAATLLPGKWFYLQGKYSLTNQAIAYGQIIHYDPNQSNLRQILAWKNLHGQLPQWQQVTGNATKELVIDQTAGLEPQIYVYQVKPSPINNNFLQLEAIQINTPALNDSQYQKALLLARNGLWTPAFTWLKTIRKQRKFPAAAQAQMDLIRLHSQLTKTQADQSWASPSQQVLADLIDGRWEKALQVFSASPQNTQEVVNLLKTDQGKLWKRTTAALRVNPNKKEVLAWVALMIAVQRGENRANSWLKGQPNINQETLAYIQDLLKILKGEVIATPALISHSSQIVGTVKPLTQIKNSQWLPVTNKTDFKLTNNQAWYQIEVSAFYDGRNWLSYPFTKLKPPKTQASKFFRQILGIETDVNIEIVVRSADNEQQITTANIQGVQLQGGVLYLLAVGSKLPQVASNVPSSKPLALTTGALTWVEPSPVTIQQLSQQNPQLAQIVLPTVWRTLQKSEEVPSFAELQAQMGEWPVQLIDLTNDGQPEVVLTTQENNGSQDLPQTLILSGDGKVIYSDFAAKSQQRLKAIAQLAEEQSLALLVEEANKYSLKRWSQSKQGFE